ncbi:MAG TPA: twin-arginine translocase TatA/TatE family subunit [Anaerolineaceae bacterium]|nr:twin-arginine translocase TatA/TatE family subunit [Anaerolineaceae bacterium]
MPFLNLGWPEIAFILIIGFILLGPDRITKTAKDLGLWLAKLKKNATFREVVKTTDEIRNYPRKIMNDVRFEDNIFFEDPAIEDDKLRDHPMRMRGSDRPKPGSPSENDTPASDDSKDQL